MLFLELACVRWFASHVPFLTFFANTVLLACFLGMAAGCVAAQHRRDYLAWSPALLALALAVAHAVRYWVRVRDGLAIAVGERRAPELVFFGAEPRPEDLDRLLVPIEWVAGFFFLALALAFLGIGQRLARSLRALPDPMAAYAVNVLGSLLGIVLFAASSRCELSPLWWFLPVALGLGHLLRPTRLVPRSPSGWAVQCALLATIVFLAEPSAARRSAGEEVLWSPYYRIDYSRPPARSIDVNLILHQAMSSRSEPTPAYAIPHLLNRDAGGRPFRDVLVIGAGSGNDVSRALEWGAERVDAVEIDPVIARLGKQDHPDRPYQDERVTLRIDDGRNFLRSTKRQYDLVVYALVDSLALHSGMANVRLESYLFTLEAFEDVRRRLKPGGLFVAYNFFRQGWIVTRLRQQAREAFGREPLVLTFPYRDAIRPEEAFWAFTVLLVGDTEALERAFAAHPAYWLDAAPAPGSPDGFRRSGGGGATPLAPARVEEPAQPLRGATDDWPFLYLRRPMIPGLTRRAVAVMGGCAILLLALMLRARTAEGRAAADVPMFLLGAGFMLIETRAVVAMALLFGSTWTVNAVVFFAVLVTILLGTVLVLKLRPARLWPVYAGLFTTLAMNAVVPLQAFLGLPPVLRGVASSALVFAPLLCAGVIFGVLFSRARRPDLALGANVAGAMLGGFAENLSMLVGFQRLSGLALAIYALSLFGTRPAAREPSGPVTPAS